MSGTTPGTGFETGLDPSRDEFSPEEREKILKWYVDTHGVGSLDLVKFTAFLIEHDPGSFKRYRRHVAAIAGQRDGVGLPQVAVGLLFLHTYAVLANDRGIFYEVIAAREWGATKRQVRETLAFAFVEAGPRGFNAVAELSDRYLRDWVDDGRPSRIDWPKGWAPDPAIFRAGIDVSTDDLADSELDAIAAWYGRMQGADAPPVRRLAALHPAAFKTHRIRYEQAIAGALPAQIFPLYTLHLATVQRRPGAIRSALQMARRLGVERHIAAQTLWWGMLYGGQTMTMTAEVIDIAGDLLDAWTIGP